jgi:hypothetical protein
MMRKPHTLRYIIVLLAIVLFPAGSGGQPWRGHPPEPYHTGSDARPPAVTAFHNLTDLWSMVRNTGMYGDIWLDLTMEWPGGLGSKYLWYGSIWASAYGAVTPSAVEGPYVSCSFIEWDTSWEFWPSDGFPLVSFNPGPTALEETRWAEDDWYLSENPEPIGVRTYQQAYSWATQGYDQLLINDIVLTHHSEYANPGVPLNAFCLSIFGDADVASADPDPELFFDDLVFYDGHAIWCNDPDATFDYISDDGLRASQADVYTYQQNPDAAYGNPEEDIYYYYNYIGPDGIVDADANSDGLSDHFTVLFKMVEGDTIYTVEPNTGLQLFANGMPPNHWEHTVGDTTYAVVPRNTSYAWDGDDPGTSADDSGEWDVTPPCNGFIGWRLLDCWIRKEDGTIERPVDVFGYPIPLSHTWWNWDENPAAGDAIRYDYLWGENQDGSGRFSGPAYLAGWVGNPIAPDAFAPANPGPFPIVHENPLALDYGTFDYKFLITCGPVDLADGDSLHVVGAWMVARGLDGLRMQADVLLDAYYRDGGWGVPDIPPVPVLFYEAGDRKVDLVWDDNAEIYSPFGGYRLYRSVFDLDEWTMVREFGADTNNYTDTEVSNGFPYYYTLCSYDAITGIESPKTNFKQTIEGDAVPVIPAWATQENWTEMVTVVPNPYRGSAEWELPYQNKIAFINLPAVCDIHIYTLAGDHIASLQHRSLGGNEGVEYWDLIGDNSKSIVSGLYVYCIENSDDRMIGKFAVIR